MHRHTGRALSALLLVLFLIAGTAPAFAAGKLTGVVNVNTATATQLTLLPGVGEARARAIITTRDQRGGFKRIEDLLEVKGIGDASLAKLRPFLSLSGESTLRAEP